MCTIFKKEKKKRTGWVGHHHVTLWRNYGPISTGRDVKAETNLRARTWHLARFPTAFGNKCNRQEVGFCSSFFLSGHVHIFCLSSGMSHLSLFLRNFSIRSTFFFFATEKTKKKSKIKGNKIQFPFVSSCDRAISDHLTNVALRSHEIVRPSVRSLSVISRNESIK